MSAIVQQRRGFTEPGSAGQIKFWYVRGCLMHSQEVHRTNSDNPTNLKASPRRPLRGRRGVLHTATNTTNTTINITAEIRPGRNTADIATGGRDNSAPGCLPVEGRNVGGRLAESRSEANRDGYQPFGGGSPRRADDERLDADQGAPVQALVNVPFTGLRTSTNPL
ncbi:hypothetical protein B0H16DRAFT_1696930 [Mycena metata]|uniref:Uncharacterized protein n=1 Tax=Mycena metata TaxID=1033252 RepID=A0AAD7HYU6_9AGAR|nr:hypothetical protein B0H16DRAFT_1696930 [Mycena metata]